MNKTPYDVFDVDEQAELKNLLLSYEDSERYVSRICICITLSNPHVKQNLHDAIFANFRKIIYQEILICRNHLIYFHYHFAVRSFILKIVLIFN